MALSVGSASATAGVLSGSGLALAIATAYQQAWVVNISSPAWGKLAGKLLVDPGLNAAATAFTTMAASLGNALAAAIVTEIQTNAVAHVTTQQIGNIPATLTAGTPIDPPTIAVDIPIT